MLGLSNSALDKFWTAFLTLNIPIIAFDCIHLFPKAVTPQPVLDLHHWYLDTMKDPLFVKADPWFVSFSTLELFYMLPIVLLSRYLIGKRDPRAALTMLIYGSTGLYSTIPCIVEFAYDKVLTDMEKATLIGSYMSFIFIYGAMIWDSSARINQALVKSGASSKKRQ
ncbi:hypothetical protein BJ508DRAFT_413350 [Ascobolus immersus RN42]|uniref:Efficient mitochondria targeting-associated protein 19 n=1 Tax=Ascobolus immersus RN42 TaxID=1160509 RepID=A0A3N4IC55_ASCIM|nr:hypothetical protein BJ508DRAFT_413350 [Ascobolus immersus RN42]